MGKKNWPVVRDEVFVSKGALGEMDLCFGNDCSCGTDDGCNDVPDC